MSRSPRYALNTIALGGRQFAPCRGLRAVPVGALSWFQSQRSVVLCDERGRPRLCAVWNRFGERFFVSCSLRQDGRLWYLHGVADRDRADFALPESLSDCHDLVVALFRQLTGPSRIPHA